MVRRPEAPAAKPETSAVDSPARFGAACQPLRMAQMYQFRLLPCLLTSAALLPGCAAIEEPPSPVVVTAAGEGPGTPLTLSMFSAEGARAQVFVDAADQARTLDVSRGSPSTTPGATWTVRKSLGGTPDSLLTFIREEDGGIGLVSTAEFSDGAFTVFSPPMPISRPSIAPGKQGSYQRAVEMKVTHLDAAGKDTGKSKASGSGTVTMTYQGTTPIPRAAANGLGTASGLLLVSTLTAELSPATVLSTTETWYDPAGTGIIAERRTERVKVMGVQIRGKQTLWLRQEDKPTSK